MAHLRRGLPVAHPGRPARRPGAVDGVEEATAPAVISRADLVGGPAIAVGGGLDVGGQGEAGVGVPEAGLGRLEIDASATRAVALARRRSCKVTPTRPADRHAGTHASERQCP
jgi:hypothetical protein